MIHFKSLVDFTFKDASDLFNKGFEGYLIPMSPPLEVYVGRFGNEGISHPEHSIVMLENDVPVGFVLQGIREAGGKKISWNGGTGIIPSHRGKKLGRLMMEYAESVLREKGVEVSTLEALSKNEPAIRLYESVGYEIQDRLLFMQQEGVIELSGGEVEFKIERFPAFQAIGSELFGHIVPWQVDPSITPKVGGEVVVASEGGEVKAAALFRNRHTYGKETEGITLFQTYAADSEEGTEALKLVLSEALESDAPIKRTTYNFALGDGRAVEILQQMGFTETDISQVFMVKELAN